MSEVVGTKQQRSLARARAGALRDGGPSAPARLWTVEAAQLLGISRRGVLRAIVAGRLPAARFGVGRGHWEIPVDCLIEAVAAGHFAVHPRRVANAGRPAKRRR